MLRVLLAVVLFVSLPSFADDPRLLAAYATLFGDDARELFDSHQATSNLVHLDIEAQIKWLLSGPDASDQNRFRWLTAGCYIFYCYAPDEDPTDDCPGALKSI